MSSDRFILMILLFSWISEQYQNKIRYKNQQATLRDSHGLTLALTSLTSQSDILRALTDCALLISILGIFKY